VLETLVDGLTFPEAPRTGSGPAMAAKREGAIETVRVDVPGAGLP
jgi:hypothetical protein